MRAENIRLEDIVGFADGRLDLQGRRLVLHDNNAFAEFRKDLVAMVGFEQTRRILTRFGYFWGQADAAAMKRIFTWDNKIEWLMAGPKLQSLEGVAKVIVKKFTMEPFEMEVLWHESLEAEEHLATLGKAESPICWILIGYASGYASFVTGKSIFFIEQKCKGKGDLICSSIGKDKESWAQELTTHLPYFQSEDIQGKIIALSETLKLKDQELSRERKKRILLEREVPYFFITIKSDKFKKVLDVATRISKFDSSIIITGETGVGKEVLARYIHNSSLRKAKQFIAVNCGALPETLAESELFGHKVGAFTGASSERRGLFEEASGGTVFLDEIAEISLSMQLKILRVLQEKEVLRLGESIPRKIDIRIIAATNKDLLKAVQNGTFRQDLYYRLKVVDIEIPPLRERKEDILALTRYFMEKITSRLNLKKVKIHPSCIAYLEKYSWPGNIRELENIIERAVVLSEGKDIYPEHLPDNIIEDNFEFKAAENTNMLVIIEKQHIQRVLSSLGNNKTKAAKLLGISNATLWRKLKAYNHLSQL